MTRWRRKPQPIAGVEIRQRRDNHGTYWVFRVRWQDPASGARLVETLDSPEDALDFRAHLRLLKRRGELGDLEKGRELLRDFGQEWFADWAAHNIAATTIRSYVSVYNRHVLPRLGHHQLRHVTPKVVEDYKQQLIAHGVGNPTVHRAMAVLQAMFRVAVIWGRATNNPVRQVSKPSTQRQRFIHPLTVEQVEGLLAHLREHRPPSEAILAELIAYSGARPQDALALSWDHVGRRRLVYDHKVVDGKRVPGAKTGEDRSRNVELLSHLRRDLQAYSIASGRRGGDVLLVARFDGAPWRTHNYKNWQRSAPPRPESAAARDRSTDRVGPFAAAAAAVGLPAITPYYLRHTYASLRLAEQRLSLKEIADEMGHSVETLSRHYSHVISDLRGRGPIDPDELIAEARQNLSRPQNAPKSQEAS